MNKKVGVYSTLGSWDESYSPINVIKYQLATLISYGYNPVLFTLTNFPKDFEIQGVEIRRTIPQIIMEPYQGFVHHKKTPINHDVDVDKITNAYNESFKDIDILLCHDVIFQDSFLAYNAALRSRNLHVKTKFFHWMHSGPSTRPAVMEPPVSFLYTLPPNSTLVYMNNYEKVGAAEMYGLFPDQVRIVHNPIDYRLQEGIHPLVDQIISEASLNTKDVVAVYPLSTTRMGSGGKQLHKAIRVMAGIKKAGMSVCLVVPNAHANADNEKSAIKEMQLTAKTLGLEDKELVFTSLIDAPKWENGVPHEVVTQLLRYSDVFVFPSVSENCPLALLEAGLGKNLMVLNDDFEPMKDFVGPNALYFKFDSRTTITTHKNEDLYYEDIGKIVVSELQHNPIYKTYREIKQKFNIDYIFKTQLEPLFFEGEEPRVQDTVQDRVQVEPMPFSDQPPEDDEEGWAPIDTPKEVKMIENYEENPAEEEFPEFDQVYKRYQRTGKLKPEKQIKIYEAISRNWCIGKAVVDIGCGIGIGTHILAREALGTWGVDNNPQNVDVAKQLYEGPKLKFDIHDIAKPPERPVGTFDVVTMIEVIEHIEDFNLALSSLKRFYDPKRRTIFFISTPNRNNDAINDGKPNNPHHIREFTAGELFEILTKHFEHVVLFDPWKLDNFDLSETIDGNSEITPILAKCEVPK